MSKKRVQFSNIVQNQLPEFVRTDYPLISEFLKQYYIGQEYVSGPLDLIQNIDQYTKVDEFTNLNEKVGLSTYITSYDSVIPVDMTNFPTGTDGFPASYGLLKINDEIITYTGLAKTAFTGCIRGFSGITSYTAESDPETLVFESTNAGVHTTGSTITNLSCLFLKEFLLKTKHQILPGLEDRELSKNIDKNLFIKQSKDFYTSKGTDRSFEILFKALYEEDVKIIRPRDFLFTPSNANYIITNDMIVESIDGDPEDLVEATLYQDEYKYDSTIDNAYAPISRIEKIVAVGGAQTYYKLGWDAGYDKDVRVDGSLYGNFSIHPKTKLVEQISIGDSTFNVDSTVGFGSTGELSVTYSDLQKGVVSYTSKSLTQFYGCDNVVGIISDKSSIGINTYAWGYSSKDQTKKIKVRINSVLSDIEYPDNTTYYGEHDVAKIKTLGIGDTSFKSKNWFYNISPIYNVKNIELLDSLDNTYKITLYSDHIFKKGDFGQITGSDLIDKRTKIINIITEKSFAIRGQGFISLTDNYTIKKSISKVESNSFPNANRYATNVQNVYKEKYTNNFLIASSSIPSYNSQPLDTSDRSITFSGVYKGDEFDIGAHTFYTGDAVYYIPQKIQEDYFSYSQIKTRTVVKSSLFKTDLGNLLEGDIPTNEGLYFIKRVSSTKIKLAKSKSDIYNSKFISIEDETTVTDCILQIYSFRFKTLDTQRLLRKILPPQNNNVSIETVPGYTGILINGVEILNYKSTEVINYGKLDNIDVLGGGSNYDIINPQPLFIKDSVGTGATGYPAISGYLREIQIIDPGFDYEETPLVKINGGNGEGAKVDVRMTLITHKVDFNSQGTSQEVGFGTTVSTIGFSTYHKFRNAEKVLYITDNQKGISGLTTDAPYYVSHVNNNTVKLHLTQGDAIVGINTVVLLSGGIGRHSLQSYDQKSILEGINVINGGSGYENKKRTAAPIGISTSLNEVTIKNHGYEKGEIVKYTTEGTVIGGLTDETEYYVTKISDDKFKLSTSKFLCGTKQYVDFTSVGVGTQVFNYQDITISLVGKVGISSIGLETFEAQVQPIFRGEIESVHLSNNGVGYGSSDIIGYNRQPEISLISGEDAQTDVVVTNGTITEILVLNGGSKYTSVPDLNLNGDGYGAVLTPIIENGSLTDVKIISGGSNYTSSSTTLSIIPAGTAVKFKASIQTWRVNLFRKYFNTFTADDGFIGHGINKDYGLQYSHLYAPRKLRESVYSVDQSGEVLYGFEDLRRNNGIEIDSDNHSPILGWAYDGNPIYGPYGYSTNNGGVVTQMKSGYKEEASTKSNRPPLDEFVPGFFIEDFTYYDISDEAVLDENNGRFGVTPEFPNGTYAYFTSLETLGASQDGPFEKYKIPSFPYFIGNNFHSSVSTANDFNYRLSSNQINIDLSNSDWMRNTQPYNLIEGNLQYEYVSIPDDLNQTMNIVNTIPGSIDNVGIETGGDFYRINDSLIFNNSETSGYGLSIDVSKVLGKQVTNISVATSTITDVEIYPSDKGGECYIFADNPHNFVNLNIINISGLSTTSTNLGGSYSIGITTNKLRLVGVGTTNAVGVTSAGATGIVTYFTVSGNLDYPNIRENDILGIGTERIKVLNIDPKLSRIRIIREYDGTVGEGHTSGTFIYEDPRKLIVNTGFKTTYDHKLNKQLYFSPSESVGLGTTAGVGIGTTISFSNPGYGISEIFIQTKSIYIPNHGLKTGDQLTYSPNNGAGIEYWKNSTSGVSTLTDGQTLYAAAINSYLIGISTVKVGLGSTGNFVGIASTHQSSTTLFFSGIGTGVYHSFKTNYKPITAQIDRQLVTVATSQTHGLTTNDNVYVDVNPSIASTFVIKYNDYNRRVLVGIKTFTSIGINTASNTITITDHGFATGEKIVHTATTPVEGLVDEGIYYIVKVDSNIFKLSDTYYNSIQPIPSIVGLGSISNGSIGPINPSLKLYKNSSAIFDLSDSSLSYTNQRILYSAFELNFYEDSDYEKLWIKNTNVVDFGVVRTGKVGIDADAKVTLTVNNDIPEILYYKLDPLYNSTLPKIKEEIVIDTETIFNNSEVKIGDSVYDGKHAITVPSTTSFTYGLSEVPEKISYTSTMTSGGPNLSYETDSSSALGPIAEVNIKNKGANYYSLPGITTISTVSGKGADIKVSSDSLGKISKIKIKNIGFNFPSDTTLSPSIGMPQIAKIIPLNSLKFIGISSVGRGYTSAPKLLVFDGKTGKLVPDIDLKYVIGESQVSILKNTYGIYDAPPTILPVENTNGVGIGTINYNATTKDVTITMSVGFSTANSFPFKVNDKVMIEGVSVGLGSTGVGYDSKNYNYKLFTLTAVDGNLGGIGTVTYSLDGEIDEGTFPGAYDSVNSSGRIIPEKYFPIFEVDLSTNDYELGEIAQSDSSTGIIDNWDNKSNMLTISSSDDFVVGQVIKGYSSKTQGIASSIRSYESYAKTKVFSKVENGWRTDSGILNDNAQRIQDSDYYQNFSYSLNSRVAYDDWYNVVSSLNHTLGFKKFADYQLESSSLSSMNVTSTSSIDIVNNLDGFANLNCVYSFDLVRENSLNFDSKIVSTEVIFANRILQDYSESSGNRVLSIDDLSGQFNSHPRPTAYSVVDSFTLSEMRARKYFILVQDQKYYAQRQLMVVDLLHDDANGYLNQYGRVSTEYDQGSFDFKVDGSFGQLLFYPTRYTINDYWITAISYNLDDNLLGTGSTSIGGLTLIDTESASVSAGTTTTIVSIASTYSSAKILVEVNPDISMNDNEFEFVELNIVHNGTDVAMTEYVKLTTNLGLRPASGYGTYYPYLESSLLKVDFIPNTGIGTTAAVNTVTVGLANSTYSGIGTYQFYHTRLEAKATSISASGSPTQNVISGYGDGYEGAYFLVQVCDKTNNEYQLSEFAVLDNYNVDDASGDTYDTEWGNVETLSGIGTLGSRPTVSGGVELVFTPKASIDVEVNVFMNGLTYVEEPQQEIDFDNGTIRSGFGIYKGTHSDIKRSFILTHNTDPIFERYFTGNDSSIVSIGSSTIKIPNHFYVTGEKITYKHVGTATSAIGIDATTFPGVGSTTFLPEELFVIKVDDELIKIASSAENALKVIPEAVSFTSVGIGTSHRFVATNQNVKLLNAIDNLIQSPVVSTAVTTTLSNSVLITDTLLEFSGITSFFASDLIRIDDEIMKIESVGVGATNVMRVRREWVGSKLAEYTTGDLITKVIGNYNIVDNVLNFTEAPYGNRPIGSTTNPPDDRDWTGISTSSTFQGRVFMKSGIVGQSTDSYSDNYLFDDISKDFNGINKEFTLKSNGSNVTGVTTETMILINDIWQERGISGNYNINQTSGISSITFVGVDTPITYDVGISSYPVGGVILSVGSTEGLGYQPLVAAGGTATVSTAGTISNISIGYSGSGYRSGIQTVVNVGVKTYSTGISNIEFIGTAAMSGGHIVSIAITNPGSGYTSTNPPDVIFDEPLSYSNIPLIYSASSPFGVGSSAIIDIQVGQGSSVIDFEIKNGGYGYGADQILTVEIGGTTGIPTTSGFKEFNLTIDETFNDEFTGWSVGELQTLDNVEKYFDGNRTDFPLSVDGEVLSIMAARGSKIDVEDIIFVFVNDILQVPGLGYKFEGGSIITLTEAPKIGDSIKISFYKGRSGVDVIEKEVIETVKEGDVLTIGYDATSGQSPYWQEDPRTVTLIDKIDSVDTSPYYGPGNVDDSNLLRPVKWCKQTEDKIINEQLIGKDRELYEPIIKPFAYITKSVGIGSTAIYVDNLKPFFDPQNESSITLGFQNKINFIRQEVKAGAAATAVVSGIGSISSIVISDGGVGYTTATVSIASTVGIGTTTQAFGTVTIGAAGTVTGVAITSPGVGYTNTNPPTVLITPPSFKIETNTVNSYTGDSGTIVGFGTTTISGGTQVIFDLVIPFDSDLRNSIITGTAITLSSLSTNDYFMVFGSNVGTVSTSITSSDSAGSTVGIGTSFVDNIYEVNSAESVLKVISGVSTYIRRVFVKVDGPPSGSPTWPGISTSDYMGEFSWGKIELDSRSGINSYTAYTLGGIGTPTSGISTSMMTQRFKSLKYKNYNV